MEIAALATVLTALGGVVKFVLDFASKQQERHTEVVAAQQASFEKFMGNHMSGFARVIEENSKAIEANTMQMRAFVQRQEDSKSA